MRNQLTLLDLLLSSAALWRVSSLFVKEFGPDNMFERLRDWAGTKSKLLSGLLDCIWCFSVVAGILYSIVWLIAPKLARVIALPFALSAGAIALERVLGKSA